MNRTIRCLVIAGILLVLLLSISCGVRQNEAYICQAREVASSIPFPALYDVKSGKLLTYDEISVKLLRYSRTTGEPYFKITINCGSRFRTQDVLYLVCPNDEGIWWHWDISLSELTTKSSLLWWQ